MFPWNEVLPYIIAQLLGAVAGQLIVYVTYLPHYKDTDDAEAILGTFCTTDAHNDRVNYFLNEFFGTFMLVLGALCCLSLPWGKANPAAASIVVGFIVWGLVTSMGGPTGPGPVSYTHLDVYKRQQQKSSPRWTASTAPFP